MVLLGQIPYSFVYMFLEMQEVWQDTQLMLTFTQPWAEARNNLFPNSLRGSIQEAISEYL